MKSSSLLLFFLIFTNFLSLSLTKTSKYQRRISSIEWASFLVRPMCGSMANDGSIECESDIRLANSSWDKSSRHWISNQSNRKRILAWVWLIIIISISTRMSDIVRFCFTRSGWNLEQWTCLCNATARKRYRNLLGDVQHHRIRDQFFGREEWFVIDYIPTMVFIRFNHCPINME